ncbi:MAG: hypothetical protein ABIA12_00205 [Candidatus Aenigmatarchaeota archaeon]
MMVVKPEPKLDADELVRMLYEGVNRFLPEEYRPLTNSFIDVMMDTSWPNTIDFMANVLKEYGRSEDGKGYKQTFSVVDELLSKVSDYGTVQRKAVQDA